MISAGLEGRLTYMTYPEPWGGPPKQPPEFLRPAPKPLPQVRYNGVSINTTLNGSRLISPQRSQGKYPSPPTAAPVNLTSHKDDITEDLAYTAYPRLFPPPPSATFAHYLPPGPYAGLYQSPYTPPLRPNFAPPPPLSPLEVPYTPTTSSSPSSSAASTGPSTTFLSPSSTFSASVLTQPSNQQQQPPQQQQHTVAAAPTPEKRPSPGFKVPSGKEGSLKHRILTRPGDVSKPAPSLQKPATETSQLQLQPQPPPPPSSEAGTVHIRKRLPAVLSPPRSPAMKANNNVIPTGNFIKGALIQLATGELRRVEDMRTEDFVQSADRSPELRLADSTVVRIEETPITGTATITLSYDQRRAQVEFESTLEHPFFVYGQGWASCSPDRTLQVYGLKVHRLQVGDVLISLTPREPNSSRSSTIITTATTTAPTPRQVQQTAANTIHLSQQYGSQISSNNHQQIYTHSQLNNSSSSNIHFINVVSNPSTSAASSSNVQIANSSTFHMSSSNTLLNSSNTHLNSSSTYMVNNQRQANSHSQPNQAIVDSPESAASKKRRWSAPDEICDEDEQISRKVKMQ